MSKHFTKMLMLVALLMPFALMAQSYHAVPYSENFDSPTGSPALPSGWVNYMTGTSGSGTFPCCYNYSSNAHSGNYYFEMESSTSQMEVVGTPEFANPAALRVSFWASTTSSTQPSLFEIGVMEDTAFVPVDTITITPFGSFGTNNYSYYTIDLDTYSGDGHRIAFRARKGGGQYTVFIDDMTISNIPGCASNPGAVSVSNISSSSATLTWASAATSAGYYVFLNNDTTWTDVYDTTHVFTGLTANTVYSGYVYNSCNGSDTSEGVYFTFRTECGEISLPFFEGFEGPYGGVPLCWSRAQHYDYYGTYFPYVYNYDAHSGSNSLAFNYGPQVIATPRIPLAANEIEVLGWLYASSTSYTGRAFEVGYMTNASDPTTFVAVDTVYTPADYTQFDIRFTDLDVTDTVNVAFRYNNSSYGYINLDDITVRQARTCIAPERIFVTANPSEQVSLQWFDTINTGWEIAYGPTGIDPDTVVENLISGLYEDSLTVTGLYDSVTYDFYVRTDCGGEYSYWQGPATIRPNLYFMTPGQTDTLYACGGTIVDDGGLDGDFSSNQTSYMVVYPTDSTQRVKLTGVASTAGSYTYYNNTLTIYDGVGTSGRVLATYTNTTNAAVDVASEEGPLTIKFQSSYYEGAGYELLVSCIDLNTCPDPYDLDFSNVAATSALVSWNYSATGTPDYWTIEAIDTANDNTLSFIAPDTARSFIITGLTEHTDYLIRLQASCTTGDTSAFISGYIFTPCLAGGNIAIGDGTASLNTHPINTYYNYSYCQFILPASELTSMSDTVYGITLPANSVGASSANIDIYIDTTSQAAYSGTNDMIAMPTTSRYFHGTVSLQAGNNDFTFDSAWVRPDRNTNIVITIDNNTGSWSSNSYWQGTGGMTGSTLYQYNDNTNIDPTSTAASSQLNGVTDNRPNVILMTPCADANCVAPNITTTVAGTTDFTVNWVAGNTESDWSVEYKAASDTVWTIEAASTTANTWSVTGLTANTIYDVRISSLCGDTTAASYTQVRTNCAAIVDFPFTEDFESFVAATDSYNGSTNFEPCWNRGPLYDPGYGYHYVYPYLYSTAHSGTKSMYMYDYSGMYHSLLVLPEMGVSVDSLIVSCWNFGGSTYDVYEVEVGVMTDPTQPSTFVVVDTLNYTTSDVNTWVYNEVEFWSYTDSGSYIAFRTTANHDGGLLIDDITVSRNSTCRRVEGIMIDSVDMVSATISFTDTFNVGSYTIAWGTSDNFADATDSADFIGTSYTITGLTGATYYHFWIRTNCSDDNSLWADGGRFRTNCALVPVTLTDAFNEGFETGFDPCSLQEFVSGTHQWQIGTPSNTPGAAHSGSNAATFTHTSSGTSTILTMPAFDFSTLNLGAELNFWHTQAVWGGDQDELTVYYRTSDTAAWTTLAHFTNDISSWTEETFTLPYSDNAPYYEIAFMGYDSYGYGICLDDIEVRHAPTCLRPDALSAIPSDVTAQVIWNSNASDALVQYRQVGTTIDTTIAAIGTSATLSGLTANTSYEFRVRGICSASDSSVWSLWYSFTTTICPNAQIATSYDSTMTSSTSSYAPIGYSYYNYGYVQTLIDSTHMAGFTGDVTALAFNPDVADRGDYFNHMTIYMANVAETDLSAGFILPDSAHNFVPVLTDGSLCYSEAGWNTFLLDSAFTWDGHSNVLIAVKRDHGSYSMGAYFRVHNTTAPMTRYAYQDGSAYDPATVSGGSTGNFVGDWQLINCEAGCAKPVITSTVYDYESATITWTGSGSDYEVNIKETYTLDWPADIAVTGNTYTFTGLNPATNYQVRVRQNCTLDSLGYSEWTYAGFITDSLPCMTPANLAASDMTNAEATFAWTARGTETQWDLHVWFAGGLDSIYRVSTNPATVSGFTAGITYNAAVRAICGSAEIEGDWSDTIQFTTATCPDVTGLAASNVTFNSVTLNWNTDAMAQSWIVEYGYHGFNQGAGTTVTVNTNTYVVNDLLDEMAYDFYVKAVCGTDWNSENWASVTATTAEIPAGTYTVTVNVNNPAWGSVTGAGTYQEGQTCTLTATPASAAYEFLNWNGDVTDNPYSFTVTGNVTITANFGELQSIADVENGTSCTIYPNPTTASTTISVMGVNGKVRISVIDMSGRTVAAETLECSADCQKVMDVADLAQGTYFVRIAGETVNMVKKLIVK
ncbi:MAG: fibronectin type III domain-containing protein [Bacteroidales bacterium]|nr:fibronectin type III domain-containing protein [Bacteroidales bacterium]